MEGIIPHRIKKRKVKPLSKFWSYFITVAALMVVNPFFSTAAFTYQVILLFFLIALAIYKRIKLFDKKIALVILAVYFLIAMQSLSFKTISPAAIYNPWLGFYIPFLIYRLLGISFFKYLVKVLYAIALFTTPIWFMQSTLPFVDSFLQNAIHQVLPYSWGTVPRSLLIYTAAWGNLIFNQALGFYRNSGLFHEPGGYAVFLILGIIINTLLQQRLFDKRNLVFIFCLLTTLSTSGYISLFIVIFAFFVRLKSTLPIKIAGIIVFAYFSIKIYYAQDFLKEKIQAHYESESYAAFSSYLGKTTEQSGRFFAFYVGLSRIYANPIFGQGIISATSLVGLGKLHAASTSGYGIMDMLASYGIFFGSFYIYYFYVGLERLRAKKSKSKVFIMMLFISMMAILSTQGLIRTTVMATLVIWGLYSEREKKNSIMQEIEEKNNKKEAITVSPNHVK